MRARVAVLVLLGALLAPASARAGDPIMPLDQVRRGMDCVGYSVIRGTEVSSFDVEIVDVVGGDPGQEGPRILIRVSGPAVDATGIGPGFSGSPIYCRDDQGTSRNAGAISESIGEYGGKTVLVTPIEQILGETPYPPAGRGRDAQLRRSARPLAAPLTVSGVSPAVGRALRAAARRRGRVLLTAPPQPLGSFPLQPLRPGSAMAVGLSSGDISLGAVGTVAYTDGDAVWSFGHPLDGAGRRGLFLQDAYVYQVVNNPNGVGEAITYKLASPGHDLGLLSNDALHAVVGRTDRLPERTRLRILARDDDTGRTRLTEAHVADENPVELPTGISPLNVVGGTALAQAATTILRSTPARQSGSMCVRLELRESDDPLRFCNRYVGDATDLGGDPEEALGGVVQSRMLSDWASAITLLDAYKGSRLHVEQAVASLRLRRGLEQAFIVGARAPSRVRRGRRMTVRLRVKQVRGATRTERFRLRVPPGTPRGRRVLQLTGTPADTTEGDFTTLLGSLFTETIDLGAEPDGGDPGPRDVDELARAVASLHVYDGVWAKFSAPGERSDPDEFPSLGRRAFRSPRARISGQVRLSVRVR